MVGQLISDGKKLAVSVPGLGTLTLNSFAVCGVEMEVDQQEASFCMEGQRFIMPTQRSLNLTLQIQATGEPAFTNKPQGFKFPENMTVQELLQEVQEKLDKRNAKK